MAIVSRFVLKIRDFLPRQALCQLLLGEQIISEVRAVMKAQACTWASIDTRILGGEIL